MTPDRRLYILALLVRYPKLAQHRADRFAAQKVASALGYSLEDTDLRTMETISDAEINVFSDGLDAGLPQVYHGGI